MLSLSIVIVNWNAGQQLHDCIVSIGLANHDDLRLDVIVVDNDSTDGSLTGIDQLGVPVRIVRNSKNRGFGAACNQGAAASSSDFLLFLNPDTRLFENSLSVPIAFMQDRVNENIGVVGIQLLDEQNLISRSCARFPTLGVFAAQILGLNRLRGRRHLNTHMTDWAHEETRNVDHVIGAFYLIRRALFNSLKGFDERFFVYLEDLDLSLRVRQAGFRSVYLADAQAFHAGGGTSRQVKARRLFYSLRSRLLYGFKHFSSWQAWILLLITLGVEPVTRTFFSLVGSGLAGVHNTWQAYGMLLRDLGSIMKMKRQ